MENSILKGNWNIIKGKIKQQWGKLTDDDFAKIEGNRDEIFGILQKQYGLAKEDVKKELDKFNHES